MLVSFDYGQVNRRELTAARDLAGWLQPELGHHVVQLDMSAVAAAQRSALLGASVDEADLRFYVPARNLIFLAHAAALAEAAKLHHVYVGSNLQDAPYAGSGYPDSSPAFIEAVQGALREGIGLKQGVQIHAPILAKNKFEAIRLGRRLELDFAMTWSCYSENQELACASCPACRARLLNFHWAGSKDPLPYAYPHTEALERALAGLAS